VNSTIRTNRPKNLDLTTIELPLPGWTSILHRISGFALFFAVAFMLVALNASLESAESFAELKATFDNSFVKLITWLILSALGYHIVAGVKHLVMDYSGIGESLEGGYVGAIITLVGGAIVIALAGVWVW
jgi:succinate dehydrogenase / fumarate reductase cytochrome b subunit